ncbi:cell division protein ZapA [Paracidovorax citrulli]|uniref:Cell division protein ZapA n=2 Tax=Paracidovorax citrulli TaxID=80869 RepID=A1TMD6_PARC0|nr:cell division protein ZapA [Paracidovorax citrulli]ABM32124.1 cell division protein ZapA [Paracidovorax citrulli AAC00-1]ATG94855.1 cell division protein ZapA [Paracidovorax citrulli]PVY66312.1 cell division protein ZapA [Paracidovorax citrulli]QCX12048.1 Cell division protein ZapA [Paracidovorax citrulli]REG69516.1 cell division protein ZapA [Paracidovorax citrulli]
MNQIEVQIMQQSYRLACPEGQQERLLQAVERVDAAMVRIRDAGKVRARERIAVLAALNLAFELADQARAAAAPPAEAPAMEAPPVVPPSTDACAATDAQATLPGGVPATAGPAQRSLLAEGEAPDGDALQALLRRLDHALGEDGRPA